MCTYGGRCEVLCDDRELPDDPEFLRELFLGVPGESDDERAARHAAARDVLAELLEEGASDALAREDAVCALWLGGVALLRSSRLAGRPTWFGEAA
ncbi:hypothetical protein ACIQCJ_00960 [Streptomyces sp. NPDC093221]|uniref:hypothetical protein n=1 Tax=Streptomyces sp. NPDC093221 TaxID=3366032 RepID=UPI0038258070